MTSYSLIWPYCMFQNSRRRMEWGMPVTSYICLSHTTSAKFFRGRPLLPFLGTSVDTGFSSWTSSFTVSCVASVEVSLALPWSVPILGSLIVRALENYFQRLCARRLNETFGRALRIFRTPPYDFVIALEFFPNPSIKRKAWEFKVPLPFPTRYNSHLRRYSKFTLLLSPTQIIGKFTIVWLCSNWLIQLSSVAVIGCRVIHCQSDPRSLFRTRAKTTLFPLITPTDWQASKATGNEIK